jgi:hypothetical protein
VKKTIPVQFIGLDEKIPVNLNRINSDANMRRRATAAEVGFFYSSPLRKPAGLSFCPQNTSGNSTRHSHDASFAYLPKNVASLRSVLPLPFKYRYYRFWS